MIQLLLEKGVNRDAQDRFGRTSVRLAVEHSKEEVLRLLLWMGADPGIPDSRGQTPLLWAAKKGNDKAVSLVLDKVTSGPRKEVQNGLPDEPDSESSGEARNESSSEVRKETSNEAAMVNGKPTDPAENEVTDKAKINHTDAKGRTGLLIAVEKGHDSVVKVLLDKGSPDLDVQNLMKKTALQLAAERGNSSLVKILLKKEAKQDLQDSLGRTALLLAAENGNNDVVEALLNGGSGSENI